jgi:predicted secreted protein
MTALTDEDIRNLTPEQKEVLKELFDLEQKERDIFKKIEEFFEKGYFVESDGSRTQCKDWEDFEAINMYRPEGNKHPLYREAIQVGDRIRTTLQKALDKNLGSLDSIKNLCKNYGVRIE